MTFCNSPACPSSTWTYRTATYSTSSTPDRTIKVRSIFKGMVFWDVASSMLVDGNQHFGGNFCLLRKGREETLVSCGNKMLTRYNRWYLLQILLHAEHVSGNTMPIIRSSRVLYRWTLPVVFGALIFRLSVWCGAGGYVSGFQAAALKHTIPTTWKSKHQIPQAATICIILSSSWWWA